MNEITSTTSPFGALILSTKRLISAGVSAPDAVRRMLAPMSVQHPDLLARTDAQIDTSEISPRLTRLPGVAAVIEEFRP